jgi:signal transduction histidine kinase
MKLTRFGRKLFLFFLLVAIVPLGIAGTVVYKYVHNKTEEEVFRQLESMSYSLHKQLDLLLLKRRFRVVDFSSDGFIRDSIEHMSLELPEKYNIREKLNTHLIANKKSLDPDILEISILSHEGLVVASTNPEQIDKNLSHEDYFRAPFLSSETRGVFFSDAITNSKSDDKLQLVFSAMLTDKTLQKPLGVIATKVKGNILQDLFKQHIYYSDNEDLSGPFGEVYIVNSDMIIIASSDVHWDCSFKNKIDEKEVQQVLVSRDRFSGIYENYKGVQVLGYALFVPETDWVIVVEKNVKDAFLPLARIKYLFGFIGGGALFMVFIFAIVISGNVSADIKKLTIGIRRVAAGNLNQPVSIGKRNDEIKEVGETFNLMMNKLRESNETNTQLIILDKMKNNIIRDVSHELKSPLAQVRLALGLWLKSLGENEEKVNKAKDEGGNYIRIVKENIGRLDKTIESILNLAELESGNLKYEKECLQLGELIHQITPGLRLVAEKKNLSLALEVSDNLPDVLVDKTQITRIISNLIDNAIKYTKSGEITVTVVRMNGEIEVAVKDTGIGIGLPKDEHEKVFDRFFQEKSSNKGVGVGLSLCDIIIKAHGGRIWVESKGKGKGSTFKFTLPFI